MRRDFPFIWTTWLAGLLSGDKHCWWAPWYKAHTQGYDKLEEDQESAARLAQWKSDHAAFVSERADALKADGYAVFVEDQNKFFLKGKVAKLSGCPDIVAVRDRAPDADLFRAIALDGVTSSTPVREAIVEECKTGKRRDSDRWQTLVYMMALPQTHDRVGDRPLRGVVWYRDGFVDVSSSALVAARPTIVAAIQRVAGIYGPDRTPSPSECARCDIASCPDRAVGDSIETPTDDF